MIFVSLLISVLFLFFFFSFCMQVNCGQTLRILNEISLFIIQTSYEMKIKYKIYLPILPPFTSPPHALSLFCLCALHVLNDLKRNEIWSFN